MRAVPKFLLFRIPGSGYLGEVSIGSAKRSTFGKAPLVTALPYDIIGPVARKSPPTTHLNCRTPLFHSSFTPSPSPSLSSFSSLFPLSAQRLLSTSLQPPPSRSFSRLSLLPSLRSDFLPFSLSASLSLHPLYLSFFSFSPSPSHTQHPHSASNDHATLSVVSFCSCFLCFSFSKPFFFSKSPLHLFLTVHRSLSLFHFSLGRTHRAVITEEDRCSRFVESTVRIHQPRDSSASTQQIRSRSLKIVRLDRSYEFAPPSFSNNVSTVKEKRKKTRVEARCERMENRRMINRRV